MNFRKTLTTAGMIAATAMIAMAPSASAATHQAWTTDGDPGATVVFRTDGDHVTVCDSDEDGYAAYLEVRNVTTNRGQYSYQIGGNARCQDLRASLGGKYDLAENNEFSFKICLRKGTGPLKWCNTKKWLNVN